MEWEGGIMRKLPVGYRFLPTDQELVSHFLTSKVNLETIEAQVIREIAADDLYRKPPQSLVRITGNEREWFFFIHDDQRLPRKQEAIRMVGDGVGFWRAYCGEYPIYDADERVVGFKTDFIYFKGELSNPKRTHWTMNLYRLPTECQKPKQE